LNELNELNETMTQKANKCPTASPESIKRMGAVRAITLARDIHVWYAKRRKNRAYKAWDEAWVIVYNKVLKLLG